MMERSKPRLRVLNLSLMIQGMARKKIKRIMTIRLFLRSLRKKKVSLYSLTNL